MLPLVPAALMAMQQQTRDIHQYMMYRKLKHFGVYIFWDGYAYQKIIYLKNFRHQIFSIIYMYNMEHLKFFLFENLLYKIFQNENFSIYSITSIYHIAGDFRGTQFS